MQCKHWQFHRGCFGVQIFPYFYVPYGEDLSQDISDGMCFSRTHCYFVTKFNSRINFITVVFEIWISRCLVWSVSDLHVGDCSSCIHALSGFCHWKSYEGIYKFFTVSSVLDSVLNSSLLKSAYLREIVTYWWFPLRPQTDKWLCSLLLTPFGIWPSKGYSVSLRKSCKRVGVMTCLLWC